MSTTVSIQSSIRVQHISGDEYFNLRESAIPLGEKVLSLCGRNSVRDKTTSINICSNFGLPHGFDGPMHPFGMHVDVFKPNCSDPVHYSHTEEFCAEITAFASLCLPQLQQHFHMEYITMQQALHSFDKVSPSYLGGDNGISLSINVSHNFSNSSHYDLLDYGPSIVLWVLDDKASQNCDQFLIFNNIIEAVGSIQNKKGVMIKISDGMLMSFQGSSLQHGTTIRRDSATGLLCPKGNTYGIHFGLSLPTLTSMRRKRIDQYMREMCITPRIICRPNSELIQQGLSIISHTHKTKLSIKSKR